MAAPMVVELRCPIGPKALLMEIRSEGELPVVSQDNLLELACRSCARSARHTDPAVRRVLHRFNFMGQLVESEVERG